MKSVSHQENTSLPLKIYPEKCLPPRMSLITDLFFNAEQKKKKNHEDILDYYY